MLECLCSIHSIEFTYTDRWSRCPFLAGKKLRTSIYSVRENAAVGKIYILKRSRSPRVKYDFLCGDQRTVTARPSSDIATYLQAICVVECALSVFMCFYEIGEDDDGNGHDDDDVDGPEQTQILNQSID